MGATIELSASSLEVAVGGEASLTATVRNTGSVIDEITLSVLGPAAAWTVVEPTTLSLLPGGDGTAQVTFRPPRSASIRAGRSPFGVMAASREDPQGSMVEEGTIEVTRLVEIAAELNPRTSRGKREGVHDLSVTNNGNAPVTVTVTATDPGDLLYLNVSPPTMVIEPGGTGAARIVAQARWELEQGAPQTIPFKVTVTPEGDAGTTIDGALVQEPKIPQPTPQELAAAAAPPPPPQPPPPPPPPAPPKPSALPKVLAALLALLVVGGGAAAVATGAVKIGGGSTATTTATTKGPTGSSAATTTSEPGNPGDTNFEITASHTAAPRDDNGNQITFDASNMTDGDDKTAWGTNGDGDGVSIRIKWDKPVHITQIGLLPGWAFTDSNGEDQFTHNRTIESVTYQFSPQGSQDQSFSASPDLQTTNVDLVADEVTIRILRTAEAQADSDKHDFTAISTVSVS